MKLQSVVDLLQQREVDAEKDRFTSRLLEQIDKKIRLPVRDLEHILTEERFLLKNFPEYNYMTQNSVITRY